MPSLAVLTIFRDESQLIFEWLLHHTAEGVTQFVLIDQGSIDSSAALVSAFAAIHGQRCGVRVDLLVEPGSHNQVHAYNKYVHLLVNEWVLLVDVDEYVYARLSFRTIPAFLATLPASAALVVLPWKRFGSSGVTASPVSAIGSFVRREIITGDDPESETFTNGSSFPPWLSGRTYNFKSLFRLDAAKAAFARVERALATRQWNESFSPPKGVIWHQHRAFYPFDGPHGRTHTAGGAGGPNDGHTVLPDARPLPSRLDGGVRLGPLRSMAEFGIHLNHFELGSCEYYAKVRL